MPPTLTSLTETRRPELKIQESWFNQRSRPLSNSQQSPRENQLAHTEATDSSLGETSAFGFFKFSSQGVSGAFDQKAKKEIQAKLANMREGSEAIGIELEMDTVGYVAMYDGDSTIAYRYDPESDPRSPHLVGALLDKRVPMSTLLKQLINRSL